jgi:lipoprotein NlpD
MALVGLLIVAAAGCATRRHPAPVVDRNKARAVPARAAAPAPPRHSADFHVVKGGDTLYSIALDHGADYREVALWNNLDDPTKIQVGQRLRVTPPPGQAQIGPARIAGRVEARSLEGKPVPAQPVPAQPVPAQPAPPPRAVTPPPAAATLFGWPAKGRILAEFAEPRKKGIDIDGKPGAPVVAAAAGRVTYVGTGIQGMGKLVVIKHDNGFITVYAHNQDIVVKEQQAVARGQKIAEIGSTDAERPKLHFQIRKGAAPVDPMLYLPKS